MMTSYTAKGDSFAAGTPQVWSQKNLVDIGGFYPYALAHDGKRLTVVLNPCGTEEQGQKSTDSVTVLLNSLDEPRREFP